MSSLTTALTCRICGFTLTPGDRFCPSCGSPNAAIASHPENETRPFEYSQQPQHQFGFPQFSGAVTGPTPASINVNVSTTPVIIRDTGTKQYPFIVRAVWLVAAWLASVTVLLLPLGLWMFNRTSAVITLQRN